MCTGSPEELRKLERKARNHADQITELLNRIEDLGLMQIVAAHGQITGPGFTIRRRGGTRWNLDT